MSVVPPDFGRASSQGSRNGRALNVRTTDAMKAHEMYNEVGTLTGFEVSNTLLSRRRACRIAGRVRGAIVERPPRRFSWLRDPDGFWAFSVDDVLFLIIEPFGDNNCYWIVAADPDPAARPLIERVRQSFAAAWG